MNSNDIQKYDFKPGLPQEFEIVNLEDLFVEFSEELTKPHRTEFFHILWFQDSKQTHLIDFIPVQVEPNSIVFVNKNSVQRFDEKSRVKGKAIIFTDSFFCQSKLDTQLLRSSILFNDLLSVSKISGSKAIAVITSIIRDLEAELDKPNDVFQSDIVRNYLRNLLLFAERERRNQDFVELNQDVDLTYGIRLKELIDLHFIEEKRVGFYCDEMNLTAKRLNQSAKKIFGKTTKELIDACIILEAKRLLAHTSESVKSIGFGLGFEEPTNFIKYFRNVTGKTPVLFRTDFVQA